MDCVGLMIMRRNTLEDNKICKIIMINKLCLISTHPSPQSVTIFLSCVSKTYVVKHKIMGVDWKTK